MRNWRSVLKTSASCLERAGSWVFRQLRSQQEGWWWAKRIPLKELVRHTLMDRITSKRSSDFSGISGNGSVTWRVNTLFCRHGKSILKEASLKAVSVSRAGEVSVKCPIVVRTAASVSWVWYVVIFNFAFLELQPLCFLFLLKQIRSLLMHWCNVPEVCQWIWKSLWCEEESVQGLCVCTCSFFQDLNLISWWINWHTLYNCNKELSTMFIYESNLLHADYLWLWRKVVCVTSVHHFEQEPRLGLQQPNLLVSPWNKVQKLLFLPSLRLSMPKSLLAVACLLV